MGSLFFVACTGSEELSLRRDSGALSGAAGAPAGTSGGAGTSGAGGSKGGGGTTGAAGTGSGTAGVTGAGTVGGASGSNTGTSGTTGTGTGTAGAGGSKSDGGAGSSGAGTGGAGTGGATDAGAAPLKYAGYMENFFILNCGGCHVAVNGKTTGNFAFSYENFLAPVNAEHAGCPNLDASKRRVVPGKPENSLVYIKASLATPPSACGGHMPNSNSMLGDTSLKLIYDWIKQGANP